MRSPGLCLLFFIGSIVLSPVIFTGCSDQQEKKTAPQTVSAPAPTTGGIYRVPLRGNPSSLDPAYVQDIYGIALVHQIFNGLVRFDTALTVLPALAETWQVQENGRVYRFILRDKARFHNQDPVSSEDVVFSLSRLIKAEPAPAVLPHLLKITGAEDYRNGSQDRVNGLVVENDKIFTVRLESPHVPFLTALGMYQAAIVPQKEVLRLGTDFGKHPVGTGPFRFASWDEGQSIRLERFDNYVAGPAYLDEIRYKIYPGGQDPMVLSDFQQGLLEEMAVYGDVKEKLAGEKGLQWFHRPSLSLFFYGMNVAHPNLSNPELRSALSAAIDRQAFVDQVYKGQFDIARTILPPGMPGYSPANQMPENTADKAQDQFKQIPGESKEDLPVLEIVSAFQTPRVEQEMALIKNTWSTIGISAKVKYITDWKAFEAYIKSDQVQIYRYVWFADMPDADSFLYPLFASESPTNFMNFKDEKVDQMLKAARGTTDPIKRAEMYQETEARIMALTPMIPLFYMNVGRVYQPYVKSASVSALGAHTMPLNKIWLDNKPLTQKD